MTPRSVYLSGPMSAFSDTDWNHPAFHEAAATLRSLGFACFNPAESFGGNTTLDYETYIAIDMAAVRACDAIVLLPGWESSSGARRELAEAKRHGKTILRYEEVVCQTG